MDLLTLSTFCAVVEEGGVLAAAKSQHTVQSNITSRIRKLEASLGVDLFFKQGRKLNLTPQGRVLLDYANKMLQLERQARAAVQNMSECAGELRIGTMESFAALRLPEVMLHLREVYPNLQLQVQSGTSRALLDAVQRHELDCAFVSGDVEQPNIKRVEILNEKLVLVRKRGVAHPKQTILFREGCAYRDKAIEWSKRQPDTYNMMEMGTLEGILGCVSVGLGVTLMPSCVIDQCMFAADVEVVDVADDLAHSPTYLIYHEQMADLTGLAQLSRPLGVLKRDSLRRQ